MSAPAGAVRGSSPRPNKRAGRTGGAGAVLCSSPGSISNRRSPACTSTFAPGTPALRYDEWVDGELEVYRQRAGRWEGWVRTYPGVGSQRLGWYAERHLLFK